MEYQLQDFDLDEETDFLLGNPVPRNNYDGEILVRNRNNPKRRRNILTMTCW